MKLLTVSDIEVGDVVRFKEGKMKLLVLNKYQHFQIRSPMFIESPIKGGTAIPAYTLYLVNLEKWMTNSLGFGNDLLHSWTIDIEVFVKCRRFKRYNIDVEALKERARGIKKEIFRSFGVYLP